MGTPRIERLIAALALVPHPEGGWYREVFRSPATVHPDDDRPARRALTVIDFLLAPGQHSAWHRVRSDEAWHLLEGGPLALWTMPPSGATVEVATLQAVGDGDLGGGGAAVAPRHVVPAGWWQAAVPADGAWALCGATVGPGFEFADFSFLRDDADARAALARRRPEATRWL